jgi:hypothetical protein
MEDDEQDGGGTGRTQKKGKKKSKGAAGKSRSKRPTARSHPSPAPRALLTVEALAELLEAEAADPSFCPCLACGTAPTQEYVRACLEAEAEVRSCPPETYQDVLEVSGLVPVHTTKAAHAQGHGHVPAQEQRPLHESHYLLFQVLDELGSDLTTQARRACDFGVYGDTAGQVKDTAAVSTEEQQQLQRQKLFAPALQCVQHCCRLLELVLPSVHHEKTVQ